ncbi:succinate dehydrogenase assembly factor 2 [Rickettsiella grylli]|nr:succinate dehydrogenase assembly factor 2 [Rickettsiella grylli]
MMKQLEKKRQRLRWQCRRGMLELDLLLKAFLDNRYLSLTPSNQVLFEQLLTYSDSALYAYLIQRKPVSDSLMQALIEQVRVRCVGE